MIFLYLAIALVVGCIFGFLACGLLSEGTITELRTQAEFYKAIIEKLNKTLAIKQQDI